MKIYNSLDLCYKNPFGAVRINEIITIRLSFEKTRKIISPSIYICEIDKWHEFKVYEFNYEKEENNLNWFSLEFSIPKAAVYFYFFKYTEDGLQYEIKKGNNMDGIVDMKGELFQITIYEKKAITEYDYKGGIMYQIFPDRFFSSGSFKEDVPADRILRTDWGAIPEYLPNHEGKILNNDYFSGDIKGIISKLDYLKELCVTAIYLNPIFEAHSNHRYDTANYLKIDPLLGTEEDFKTLCIEAKKRDIVIILDGVFSHTGSDSVYFNKNLRYDSIGAFNSIDSKYYDWYCFQNFPNEYSSWWGFDTLPELNKTNESLVKFICDKDGVIYKWIKAGAYGFRLDVVDELNKEILERIKESLLEHGGKILIGEVWEDASTKRSYGHLREYLLGFQLDSTMNYPFKNAIISYIRYGSSDYFFNTIMSIVENYPKDVLDSVMNMLSTHDIERAITKLISPETNDNDRYWQAANNDLTYEGYKFGKSLLKLASLIQYFLPGIPCIYYGDEAGMYGYKDPFNRACYPWGNEDGELIEFFKSLGTLRKDNNVFKEGKFKILNIDENLLIMERFEKEVSIILCINRSNTYISLKDNVKNINSYANIFQIGEYNNLRLSSYSAVVFKK